MKNLFRIILAVYSILIIAVSVSPSMGVGSVEINSIEFRSDYILHALAFVVVPIFAFVASGFSCTSKQWFFYLTIATLLALGAEFIQILTPSRTFNPIDILSNLFGLSLGILISRLWCRSRLQRASRKHENLTDPWK
ncbi:VanZ family protein [Perlabentimonas gracilis]|uniref:VanZ family protein n=1 Tax=Perlabentimonas gracilis TaxID=2715279 RepID=UPI0014075907|nr:VanZ family protein [Perlabentimonas gracilis]NHB69039.1 VanZ family protein [Perlabentimonas gracilis]